MKTSPDITIAIPTFNREAVLLDTIKDCLKQSIENLEVIVVDQTKKHGKEYLEELKKIDDPRLRYFYVDPPRVTAAKNFALSKAQAPIVLFLDDDVQFDEKLAHEHLAVYEALPEVSAVAGRVLQKGFPILDEFLKFDELAVSHGGFTAKKSGYTNAFPGGNVSMKVYDALKVGGFDTRYYFNAFREESDMSMKMTRAGMKIYFEPKAVLTHLAAHSGGSRVKAYKDIRDTFMFYKNELFFTLRFAQHKQKALRHKIKEYCEHTSKKIRWRRKLYFYGGIIAAYWRMLFGRQIKSQERMV